MTRYKSLTYLLTYAYVYSFHLVTYSYLNLDYVCDDMFRLCGQAVVRLDAVTISVQLYFDLNSKISLSVTMDLRE